MSKERDPIIRVYADLSGKHHVLESYGAMREVEIHVLRLEKQNPPTRMHSYHSYIYLRTFNNCEGIIEGVTTWWNTSEFLFVLDAKNKVYNNGGSIIYR